MFHANLGDLDPYPPPKRSTPTTPSTAKSTFGLFAVLNVATLAFTIAFVPETRGRSLEQIEGHFRERYGAVALSAPGRPR